MPVSVVGPLISYLADYLSVQESLSVSVWDGELARYDAAGKPVTPSNTTGSWPAIKLFMEPPGFRRTHTIGANSYDDTGIIRIEVWSTTREQTEALMTVIEELFERQITDYTDIDLGGDPSNPNYIIKMTLETWVSVQEEGVRTSTSNYLYRGDLYWETQFHGTVNTLR